MSLTLRQRQAPAQRLALRGILPETLLGMDDSDVAALPIAVGNQNTPLGELFTLERASGDDDLLVIEPLDDRLDRVGEGLSSGRLQVRGDVGDYAGRAMQGGELTIDGHAGACAGSALAGGVLRIQGDAGDRVGAPGAGERQGQQGGLIHVRGNVGTRAGECQRRGFLIIDGDAGALLAHRMIAGTVYVGGQAGSMAGYGMRRGSVLLRQQPLQMVETMRANGHQSLSFLPLLLRHLGELSGGTVVNDDPARPTQRFLGDLACGGLGEILIL